jgi:SAM-dependent methyltransferase
MVSFGEQRTIASTFPLPERVLFRAMGVADPAHYLHFRYLRRMLDAWGAEPKTILDAGCGRGDYSIYLARRYPGAKVLGLDVDPDRVKRNQAAAAALGLSNVNFEIGDLTARQFDRPFELIVSIDVLEHIPQQDQALRNLASSLSPSGRAYFHIPTVRTREVPFSGLLKDFRAWAHEEHTADDLTADQFVDKVKKNGFEVLKVEQTFGRWTGELAVSLFAIPFRKSLFNKVMQAMLAPVCRGLLLLDSLEPQPTRYAVGVTLQRDTQKLA